MRNTFSKIALAAGFLLALALTFSCSSDDGDAGGGQSSSVVPSSSSSDAASSSSDASSSSVLRECEAIFNPANRFCYDGTVYDKCSGQEYNPDYQFCDGIVYDKYKCGETYIYTNHYDKFCYDGTVYDRCDGREYNPDYQFCYLSWVYDKYKCGGQTYSYTNHYDKFCYDGVVYYKCDGMEYNPSIYICSGVLAIPAKCNGTSYNPLTHYCPNGTMMAYGFVTYGDKTYKTVVIGEQVWMAENLDYAVDGSKCYTNDDDCVKYGRLYDWATAMGVNSRYNSEEWGGSDVNHRGICPSGWHIPSDDEWHTLIDFVGYPSGTKLKASVGWNSCDGVPFGTDDYGFSALPGGGLGYLYRPFGKAGDVGYWWSATENTASSAYFRYMSCYSEDAGRSVEKGLLSSVRCLKD
jgi:uncharacterized protein (TIGR02145 family)